MSKLKRGALVVGISLALLLGILGGLRPGLTQAQQPPWPTPPPAPLLPPPGRVPEISVNRASIPDIPGAAVTIVQPLPGSPTPRIPPVPAILFRSVEPDASQRISLRIEGGSIRQTMQLVYVPLALNQVSEPAFAGNVLRVFELKTLDPQGKSFVPQIQRPWRLEVPIGRAPEGAGGERLLLARYDDDSRQWVYLVTSFDSKSRSLVARILKIGQFAVVAERPIF